MWTMKNTDSKPMHSAILRHWALFSLQPTLQKDEVIGSSAAKADTSEQECRAIVMFLGDFHAKWKGT